MWHLKQLLPLAYDSEYIVNDAAGNYRERCTWRMWFGRCFSIRYERLT